MARETGTLPNRLISANATALAIVSTLGLALCGAEPLLASSFVVSPTIVNLSVARTSAVVLVANQGDAEVRIAVSGFTWTEGTDGGMGLEPTEEIAVFPPLLAVPAHAQKRVRIGVLDRQALRGGVEKSYRVYFEELASNDEPPLPGQIRMLARFGVPVFVTPSRAASGLGVEGEELASGHLQFRLANPGNAHDRIQSIEVKGIGPDGAVVFEREVRGWYLLAGGIRAYTMELSSPECASASSIRIAARGQSLTASSSLALDAASCRVATR